MVSTTTMIAAPIAVISVAVRSDPARVPSGTGPALVFPRRWDWLRAGERPTYQKAADNRPRKAKPREQRERPVPNSGPVRVGSCGLGLLSRVVWTPAWLMISPSLSEAYHQAV